MTTTTGRRVRVRAPELAGRGWINTGGQPLTLAGLRGRVVLLDFWTSCCVNCLHVLDELRPLEAELSDVLVVVGVHSPKFAHEAEPGVVADAVERYDVHHPVLDDPDLMTWNAYAARAWPTLAVVDPEGYVVAQMSGEGHAHGLGVLVRELVEEHEAKGTLRRGDAPYVPLPVPSTTLRFPGKARALPGGGVLVSDTAHHQLVELADDLGTEVRRIGSGARGLVDGDPAAAGFAEPQGLAILPRDVAERVGYDVVVADSVDHALRGLRLADGRVTTVAGTGRQLRRRASGGAALVQDLSTPWDVTWFDGQVVVAMAGVHQLWGFDPVAGTVRVLAGTTWEGLVDGPAEEAMLAQPSGLATSADGARVWFVDAESSSLRYLERGEGPGYRIGTAHGTGLYDFGYRDGPARGALLQHPLGVAVLPDGSVAVADTYNGAVRRYDPATAEVTTLARDLAEPSDVLLDPRDAATLVVVESAAHGLTRTPLPVAAQRVDAGRQRVARPPTEVSPGPLRLRVAFTPPTGQVLDDRFGDPTRLVVSASPPELLEHGAGDDRGLERDLVVADMPTDGVLHVSVQAAACDADAEHAACHLYQQDWGIPVRLSPGAADELVLDLRGV